MGAYSYTLPSVFEPPPDSKPGPDGDPAEPIAVNTPSVEPQGASSKSTSDPSQLRSLLLAGLLVLRVYESRDVKFRVSAETILCLHSDSAWVGR